MKYLNYLYNWYKLFGFTTESLSHRILGPVAFYRELADKAKWINAAKAKRLACAQKSHEVFVSKYGHWESSADWCKRQAELDRVNRRAW
jgi:hypothetical protein